MGEGEKQGRREQMDRFTGQLVKQGMSPERAKQQARTEAIKADRRESKR